MPLDLDSLSGSFTVSFRGAPVASPLSGAKAVFLEWISGAKVGPEWATFSSSHDAGRGFEVMTPKGPMEAPLARMRLYLAPAFVHERQAPAQRPELARWLEENPEVQRIEEYRLEEGRRYSARVVEEPVTLPPEGPGQPTRQGKTKLLEVSDQPFTDGPQRPAVPSTR